MIRYSESESMESYLFRCGQNRMEPVLLNHCKTSTSNLKLGWVGVDQTRLSLRFFTFYTVYMCILLIFRLFTLKIVPKNQGKRLLEQSTVQAFSRCIWCVVPAEGWIMAANGKWISTSQTPSYSCNCWTIIGLAFSESADLFRNSMDFELLRS